MFWFKKSGFFGVGLFSCLDGHSMDSINACRTSALCRSTHDSAGWRRGFLPDYWLYWKGICSPIPIAATLDAAKQRIDYHASKIVEDCKPAGFSRCTGQFNPESYPVRAFRALCLGESRYIEPLTALNSTLFTEHSQWDGPLRARLTKCCQPIHPGKNCSISSTECYEKRTDLYVV